MKKSKLPQLPKGNSALIPRDIAGGKIVRQAVPKKIRRADDDDDDYGDAVEGTLERFSSLPTMSISEIGGGSASSGSDGGNGRVTADNYQAMYLKQRQKAAEEAAAKQSIQQAIKETIQKGV